MTIRLKSGTAFGVGFGWYGFAAERWSGPNGTWFGVLDLGPLSVWFDSLPGQTVGERGVW